MTERFMLHPIEARMALLHEVFVCHTDLALVRALHGRGNDWRWYYDEENEPDRSQREKAILADAQRSQTLMDGVDQILTGTVLSRNEESAVRLRLGFDGQGIRTFAEIGEELGGVTGNRAGQIYRKTIKRLRHPVRSRRLSPFLP